MILGDVAIRWGGLAASHALLKFEAWRFVTYMFLHDPVSLFHIIFNMLALWWFGTELEDIWGGKKFLIFYFVCGIGAGLFSLLYLVIGYPVLVIGASGAVLGILTAYAHYYPARQVLLFFVIPLKVKTLVIGYAAISVLLSISAFRGNGGGGISHITHLGGILIAWLYLKILPMLQVKTGQWVYRLKKRRR
jgi:membrane associated rhomboid family serine protease